MADEDVTVGGKTFAADLVTVEGEIKRVARDKIGWGAPGTYNDTDLTHPVPVSGTDGAGGATNLATQATLVAILAAVDGLEANTTGLASQTTAAAIQAKLSADPATQTTLAAVLSALQGTLTTAPTTAGDVATTLTDGRKTVPAAGTAVALRATLACKWVTVTALKTNTDQVNVGGSAVLATLGASTGSPLAAGDAITIPVNDAAKVFVDARVNGEGVSFTVGS